LKKLVLIFLLVIIVLAFYLVSKFKGTLPAVLPPKEPTQSKIIPNDLGLNLPPGYSIDIFATNLKSPRDLTFDREGTLIVSIPQEGKVVALPDRDKDGKADNSTILTDKLDRPHGITLKDDKIYIAEVKRIVSFNYDSQNLKISNEKHIIDLPGGGRHNTRTIGFGIDGKLYVSVGSTCDVCVEKDERNGAILQVDVEKGDQRIFAKGLRNSVFIAFQPESSQIWATEMGRDFLGDNLPPEEINIIEDEKDYGWPFCYGNKVIDTKFSKDVNCQNTKSPIYQMCAHCAPLGLAFIKSSQFAKEWQGDLLVSYHGSWNSTKPVGYKVAKLKVDDGKISKEDDFITGFLQGNQAVGRPVDLIFDKDGALFLSDDKKGVVYKITGKN